MIRSIIVEDEKPALDRLEGFLNQIPDIQIVATSSSGKEAAQLIEDEKPDLVFLDINLPDVSGIDILHLLSFRPLIIFITAYNQYAIKAFELQAIDYLLKPFPRERLELAVQKAREKLLSEQDPSASLKRLISSWNPQKNYLKRIPSKIGDKIYIIVDENIVYLASEEKLVFAHTPESKFLINYRLDELQARLDPDKFFRIHRSTIVNLNYVKTIESWFAGGYRMIVRDKQESELVISRSAGKLLRQKLGW
jgi:two-component system LytT family response regulator/two-component system response regulator LytT